MILGGVITLIGKDWSEYKNDYILRTDAVWEKFKLKEWFLIDHKIFHFSASEQAYMMIEPNDMYAHMFEPRKKNEAKCSELLGRADLDLRG